MEVKKKLTAKIIRIRDKKSKCPSCKDHSNVVYMPFCSQKCSNLDLMKWLSDDNSVNIDKN